MQIIVVAGQKGGSGKSSICRNLAVAAGEDVALIDRDPQGSLTSWWNRRKAPTPPLVTVRGSLADTLDALRDAGMRLVFIDTAPSVSSGLAEILAAANMILLGPVANFRRLRAVRHVGRVWASACEAANDSERHRLDAEAPSTGRFQGTAL